MGTSTISENVEVFDVANVINGNSQMGSSLVGEKVECFDSLMSDVNGSASMVVEEQCDDKRVDRMLLKKKRKKEKLKALKVDSSAEISLVKNESSSTGVSCLETKFKALVGVSDVTGDIDGGSVVETSLVKEKADCLKSSTRDDNGCEPMVVQEQYDDEKVSRMQLKRKRKKEKEKPLEKDSSAEISSVQLKTKTKKEKEKALKKDSTAEISSVQLKRKKKEKEKAPKKDSSAEISSMQLKRKRKKEKEKSLKKDSSAEIFSVKSESLSLGALIPKMESKVLVEGQCVSVGMVSSSCVDVEPSGNEALIKPVEEDDVSQSLSMSLERPVIQRSSKKLLVLDVNGLLADLVPYTSYGVRPDTVISQKSVYKRPYCDDFLKFCLDRFNIGIWSSRTRKNVEMVADFLMGDSRKKLLFCWDQFHCTKTGFTTVENREKPLVLKELRKLWENFDKTLPWKKGEYDESNTLLLDDSPYKALCNPAYTAIFPYPYDYRNHTDSSLGPGGDLRMYLERLADADNVQKFVAENPYGQRAITESNASWGFYRRIIKIVSSRYQRYR